MWFECHWRYTSAPPSSTSTNTFEEMKRRLSRFMFFDAKQTAARCFIIARFARTAVQVVSIQSTLPSLQNSVQASQTCLKLFFPTTLSLSFFSHTNAACDAPEAPGHIPKTRGQSTGSDFIPAQTDLGARNHRKAGSIISSRPWRTRSQKDQLDHHN